MSTNQLLAIAKEVVEAELSGITEGPLASDTASSSIISWSFEQFGFNDQDKADQKTPEHRGNTKDRFSYGQLLEDAMQEILKIYNADTFNRGKGLGKKTRTDCLQALEDDTAIAIERPSNIGDFQIRNGTHAFQSIAVLGGKTYWGANAPPQDHLDDIESFFYVLAWTCIQLNGTENVKARKHLIYLEELPGNICARMKIDMVASPMIRITGRFKTPIFSKLLESLGEFCDEQYSKKARASRKKKKFPSLAEIYEATKQGHDHDKFLHILRAGIDAQALQDRIFFNFFQTKTSARYCHKLTKSSLQHLYPSRIKKLPAGASFTPGQKHQPKV